MIRRCVVNTVEEYCRIFVPNMSALVSVIKSIWWVIKLCSHKKYSSEIGVHADVGNLYNDCKMIVPSTD